MTEASVSLLHHGLQVHEFVQPVRPQFAAVARAFDAAERRRGGAREHLVDRGHAGVDVTREALFFRRITGPHARTEPERHRVRQRDRLIHVGDLERSEEHTSELQSLMRNSYAVFWLKKKK